MDKKAKFLLIIDDVFNIYARGTVVTGQIKKGELKVGDMLELIADDKVFKTKCKMLEKYRRIVNEAKEGDWVGVVLSDVSKNDVKRGMKLIVRE